jgi:site-specific DNA recombinase
VVIVDSPAVIPHLAATVVSKEIFPDARPARFILDSGPTIACSLARLLHERGLRTAQGLERWNLASIRGLLTNPAYIGRVYGNRWRRRRSLERRSATAPSKHSSFSRVNMPREQWILVAQISALVSEEQWERVQARLAANRRFAHHNNKVHPYLLRNLVSCGVCGLSCLARTTIHQLRYYSCTGKMPALFSHREQKGSVAAGH